MIKFEKTAINIKKTLMQGACYTVYNGENRIYGVLAEGGCATFVVISIDKEKIIYSCDAPGATGSWGVVAASDGRIYFGSYSNAGFYRFDPETEILETLRDNLPNARFIFSLDTDSKNNVYGGTWPNCAVFKYNGNTEKLEFYDERIVEKEDYVRMVLYNEERNILYSSISAHCHLIEYNPGKGPGTDILPEKYRKESFIRLMGIYKGKLSVYMIKSMKILLFDTKNGKLLKEIDCPEEKTENPPCNVPIEHLVTGGRNGGILLDMENMKSYNFKGEKDDVIMGIWPFSDKKSLLISSFEGKIYLYNTETGIKRKLDIEIPRKNIEVRQLHLTENGDIHASGYLRGGNYIYDSEMDSGKQYDGIGQCEGITSHRGKVYFGKYPGAYIYEYDPVKPWNVPGNPRELFELKSAYNQDRPFAMKADNGKLYVGSIPNYGDVQGTLAIYDIDKRTCEVKKDFSNGRSIISIQIKDGILYGGTTVYGGLGSYTEEKSGMVFALNIANGEYLYRTVPVEECKNAGGLCLTEDGKILGCADSTFFILDAISGKKEFEKKLTDFDSAKNYKWEISFIKKGKGRLYYIVTANTLFSYNHETKEIKKQLDEKVNLLEFDLSGRLYCQYEKNVREIIRSIKPVE